MDLGYFGWQLQEHLLLELSWLDLRVLSCLVDPRHLLPQNLELPKNQTT